MSWKSIAITGLLCVIASPAWADPSATATLLGLDTDGNWVWSVTATPDASMFHDSGPDGTPPNTVGGSLALEVGITASDRDLVSAAANTTNFDKDNPADDIAGFAFWTSADSGVKANVATNQVVAGLGSTFLTAGTATEALRVHTVRPTSTALTTSLTLSGAYTGNGRVAQDGSNYDTVTGALSKVGWAWQCESVDDATDLGDLAILWQPTTMRHMQSGQRWQDADFTGDGFVDLGDLAVLGANYGISGTPIQIGQLPVRSTFL